MLNLKSSNTSLLEVIIPSKDEHVSIRDLSDLTLQTIFDAYWASSISFVIKFFVINLNMGPAQ